MSEALDEAWFSSLGAPLDEAERAEIAAYLRGLKLPADLPVHTASSWGEANRFCRQPAGAWWQAEEAERTRLELSAHLDPGALPAHPFLRKYALYCGGRWPLGVYDQRFAIF